MNVLREWAMPSKETFRIQPIENFINRNLKKEIEKNKIIIDPFSNGKRLTANSIINDLNPSINADYHLDALEFLKMFDTNSVDGVLYDPPYSPRQVSECYKGFGYKVTQETTSSKWRAKHLDEIERILTPGGKLLSFGWNSNGGGEKRGFKKVEILVVAHGGSHNDTLCVAEIKEAMRW